MKKEKFIYDYFLISENVDEVTKRTLWAFKYSIDNRYPIGSYKGIQMLVFNKFDLLLNKEEVIRTIKRLKDMDIITTGKYNYMFPDKDKFFFICSSNDVDKIGECAK